MAKANTSPKNARRPNGRYQRTVGKERKRGREKKAERKTSILVAIALGLGVASIVYSILGLHITDNSVESFKPPSMNNVFHSIQNSTRTNVDSNESIDRKHQETNTGGSRRFYKYDAAGPKAIPGTARSHALPNAVPSTNTIPDEYAENKTYHISQRTNTSKPLSLIRRREWGRKARFNWNHTYHDDYRTLYLYNPSILPLHNTIPRNDKDFRTDDYDYSEDPDALSKDDLMALTGGDPSVRYVSTFRAYLGCNCFGRNRTDRTLMTAGEQISYLAIALLDESLDVVEGTDVLIDLNAGPGRGVYERQFAEDCRISLAKGGIFLLCNEEIRQIRITRTPAKKQEKPSPSSVPPQPPPGYGTEKGIPVPYVYPNVHGDGLNVTLLSIHLKVGGGKNFNMFRSSCQNFESRTNTSGGPSNQVTEHFIQLFPLWHTFRKIHFVRDGDKFSFHFREPVYCKKKQEEVGQQVHGVPRPSFDTPDKFHNISKCQNKGETNCTNPIELSFFDAERDHGTACCVRVFLPQDEENETGPTNNKGNNSRGREVMVGISHKKLSRRDNFWLQDIHNRYEHFGVDRFVSRFVAYETQYPFDVVAISGWFCLGFSNDPVELNHPTRSTLAGKNLEFRLDLFDDIYDCPIIHFASGFSEVVGNASRAIIGYGVNDCHPRMFMVEKDEIVRMLTTG